MRSEEEIRDAWNRLDDDLDNPHGLPRQNVAREDDAYQRGYLKALAWVLEQSS